MHRLRLRGPLRALPLAVLTLVLSAPLASAVTWSSAQLGDFYPIAQAQDAAVRQVGRAVVFFGNATGFVVSPDGYVLTNYHVYQSFGRSGYVYLEWTGAGYRQRLWIQAVTASARYDVALYKASGASGLPYVPITARSARVGEDVFVVGHPNGRSQEVSYGRVLATGIEIGGRPSIEYSAQTWWGSSGSPVCDRQGHAVAIHWGWDANGRSNGRLTGVPFSLITQAVPEIARLVGGGGSAPSASAPSSGSSRGSSATVPTRPGITTIRLGDTVQGRVAAAGEWQLYRLDVPARGDLTLRLTGPAGADLDLFLWKWDAGSTRGVGSSEGVTSDETLTVSDASPGAYIIVVRAMAGGGSFTLTSALDQPSTVSPTSRASAAGFLAGTGDWSLFTIDQAGTSLQVSVDGPSHADFDLYVFRGRQLDARAVVGYGDGPTSDEAVVLQTSPGPYLILVRSDRGAGRFTVTVGR